MSAAVPPLELLAELTHRCPLRCGYCSNPLELEAAARELDTATWCRVLDVAAALGVLQVHFSGGEPSARRDLEALVAHARALDLYTNLITSGVLLDRARLAALVEAGLEHVQLSVQDSDPASADRIAGFRGHARKLAFARWLGELGVAFTLNAVVHRQNLERLDALIALAVELGAQRLEVAHVQYYGWARANLGALLPTAEQLDAATACVEQARAALRGRLRIDYVIPDFHAELPKACMDGWGRRFLGVTPSGDVLPCQAAQTLPGMQFENVRERGLDEIWSRSAAFQRFRGTAWMPEPCRSCERREVDWGGGRCQALALDGDAAAPAPGCAHSPQHAVVPRRAETASRDAAATYRYRGADVA